MHRGNRVRRQLEAERAAATKVQAVHRGWSARKAEPGLASAAARARRRERAASERGEVAAVLEDVKRIQTVHRGKRRRGPYCLSVPTDALLFLRLHGFSI